MQKSIRRAVLVLAAALTTLAVPAVAGAELLSPGDVGTAAYTRMDAETFALDPALKKSDFDNERIDGAGVAESAYRWPPPPFTGPVAFTCPVTGCTGYDGRAFGRADVAAGRLQAVARGSVHIGNPPSDGYGLAGYIFSDGASAIADTITLSEPATVILRGTVDGRTGGSNSHYDEQGNDPQTSVDVSISFTGDDFDCGPESCERERFGGVEEEYEASIVHCGGTCAAPGDLIDEMLYDDHDDSFEVAVALPAGTSYFNAELAAAVHFQVYGERNELVNKWASLDFGSSVEFEIEVPDHVVATSGSGLLPIVGGAAETPDTTPPTIVAPADVSVATDPGLATAALDPGTATATDDRGAATVAGARGDGGALDDPYPVGTTTITWTATDEAGNTATATQTIVVTDGEKPVLDLPAAQTANASGPAGAAVAYSATASDNVGVVSLSCTPASGSTFPVGTATVTCTASDAAGNTATGTFAVTVRGAAGQLAELIQRIRTTLDLGRTERGILARLVAADRLVGRSTRAVCVLLRSVERSLTRIPGADAAEALADVRRIEGALGC